MIGEIMACVFTCFHTATRWDGGVAPSLDPSDPKSQGVSEARGINNAGLIAVNNPPKLPSFAGAAVSNGTTTTILTPLIGPTSNWDSANAINNSGQIAGRAASASGYNRAVIWNGSTPTALGALGPFGSEATAINDSGQAAGWSYIASGAAIHATFWTDGLTIDLGTLGGTQSRAYGINSTGQVVGSADIGGSERAILWSGGTAIDLSNLVSGVHLTRAMDINDAGWIVGLTDHSYGFLLTPTEVSAVPEPAAYVLFDLGLVGLGFSSRKKA